MGTSQSIQLTRDTQAPSLAVSELESALSLIDTSELLERLQEYRWTGRPGYPLFAMWRAYAVSFLLNMPHTNALVRRLQDDPALRTFCGFETKLPHRTTFNRFIHRLSDHRDHVDRCLAQLTDRLASELPAFGQRIAIDSTTVRTHSNPDREPCSDLEATWTAKTPKPTDRGEKAWAFGYKYHLLADAEHGVPIVGFTSTGSRNDTKTLPELMDMASD